MPKYEHIFFQQGFWWSADQEAATKTINAVAKGALPDYTFTHKIDWDEGTGLGDKAKLKALPTIIYNLLAALNITIDSFNGGAAHLYAEVDADDIDLTVGSPIDMGIPAADKTNYLDVNNGDLSPLGLTDALFKMGKTNTIKIYLWVDAGNVVISKARYGSSLGCIQSSITKIVGIQLKGMLRVAFDYGINVATMNIRTAAYDNPSVGSLGLWTSDQAIFATATFACADMFVLSMKQVGALPTDILNLSIDAIQS
jgi:hypothetical protein